MIFRIVFNILMFLSVLFLPWWVTVIVAMVFLSKFKAYEIIFWGVFVDILYSASVPSFLNIEYLFTITFIVLLIISHYLKRRLMFYDV